MSAMHRHLSKGEDFVNGPARYNGHISRSRRVQRPRKILQVSSHPEDKAPITGDPMVQEQLMTMVRLEMNKQTTKDTVRKFAQEQSEKMKDRNEKAKAEIEKQERLLQERSRRGYDQALADINRSADEFEEQLRASRARMEKGKAEFEDWEEKMTRERNQGYFFQKLYESDAQKAKRKQKQMKGSSSSDANQLRSLIDQSQAFSSAQSLVPRQKSNVRASILVFLSLNLSFLAIADILSDSPTYMLDALHAALAVTLLTSVWFERQLLTPSNKEDRKN